MSEQDEIELLPEGEPEEKKPQLKDLMDDYHRIDPLRHIKPVFILFVHGFLAFIFGSMVNYLVINNYIRSYHVTSLIVALIVFTFLRINYKTGNRK